MLLCVRSAQGEYNVALVNLPAQRGREIRIELSQLEADVGNARKEFEQEVQILREKRESTKKLPYQTRSVKYFTELFRLSLLYQSLGKNYFQGVRGDSAVIDETVGLQCLKPLKNNNDIWNLDSHFVSRV